MQGMPRVISDNELTTGLTKASPVVIPDKMPMTTLNLDLNQKAKSEQQKLLMNTIVKLRKTVLSRKHYNTLTFRQ